MRTLLVILALYGPVSFGNELISIISHKFNSYQSGNQRREVFHGYDDNNELKISIYHHVQIPRIRETTEDRHTFSLVYYKTDGSSSGYPVTAEQYAEIVGDLQMTGTLYGFWVWPSGCQAKLIFEPDFYRFNNSYLECQ